MDFPTLKWNLRAANNYEYTFHFLTILGLPCRYSFRVLYCSHQHYRIYCTLLDWKSYYVPKHLNQLLGHFDKKENESPGLNIRYWIRGPVSPFKLSASISFPNKNKRRCILKQHSACSSLKNSFRMRKGEFNSIWGQVPTFLFNASEFQFHLENRANNTYQIWLFKDQVTKGLPLDIVIIFKRKF